MKKIYYYLIEAIKKEKELIKFTVILFLIGMISGTVFTNVLTNDDKILLKDQLTSFLNEVKMLSPNVFGMKTFLNSFLSNTLELTIIFIFGISMIGIVFIIFYIFFKGFIMGISMSSFIINHGLKGILGMIIYTIPFYVFNIIIYIFMAFFALDASIKFIKALIKKGNLNFKTFFGKYLLSYLISFMMLIIYSLGNSFIMPYLLKLFTLLL